MAKKVKKVKWLGPKKSSDAAASSRKVGLQLGNKKDAARKKSFGVTEVRLDYESAKNLFALVGRRKGIDPRVVTVQEHWLEIDDKRARIVCAVMGIPDDDGTRDEQIHSRWGYDGCKLCGLSHDLFKQHPKNSKDAVDKRGFELAKEISSKKSHRLEVVSGDLALVKERNKIIQTPFFDEAALVGKRLNISDNAVEVMLKAIEEACFDPEDLWGMPVNFVGGKKQGASHIIERVDFFPKHKIKKMPDNIVDFEGLMKVDLKKIDDAYAALKKSIPEILAGRKKMGGKKKGDVAASTASSGKKRSKVV